MTHKWPAAEPLKIAGGFNFPEGVSAAADGSVYLVNCHNDIINRVSPDGTVSEFARTPGKGHGSKLRAGGNLVVCDYAANSVVEFDPAGNLIGRIDRDIDGNALSRGPNDVIVTSSGDLYFTAPQGSNSANPVGNVYHHARETGRTTIVAGGLAFPNGLSLSAGEDYLYVAESAESRIMKYPILDPGSLGTSEVFVQLPGGHDPDGIDFDVDGNLYIAYYGGGAVVVVNPEGQIAAEFPVPGKRPTNLSFGGPNGDWLYVTETETSSLYRLEIGHKGLHLPGW